MSSKDSQILLELYKLHAELAERVASLRETLNQIHSAMVIGIVAASAWSYRYGSTGDVAWMLPSLGILVSLSWMLALGSATGRLSAKHKVLVALEAELPFDFLNRESGEFVNYRFFKRKWTALLMPAVVCVMCVIWLIRQCSQPNICS